MSKHAHPAHEHAHHEHAHHGHAHGVSDETRVLAVAALTGLYMFVEAAVGVWAGSLALIADAGHMLADVAALVLAWLGFRLARRPADWRRTYGFDRFSVLAAFVNGLALFAIAGWIGLEAIERLSAPAPILAGPMLWAAAGGLAVNLIAFAVLHGGDKESLNMRGAALHVLGDLLGSLGAILAAGVILLTGWTGADPLLSVAVSLLILVGGWRLVRESGRILLEAAPLDFDSRAVTADLATLPGVERVHHLHAWSITPTRRLATLHACLEPGADPAAAVAAIKRRLREAHRVDHATVEIEHPGAEPAPGCC